MSTPTLNDISIILEFQTLNQKEQQIKNTMYKVFESTQVNKSSTFGTNTQFYMYLEQLKAHLKENK